MIKSGVEINDGRLAIKRAAKRYRGLHHRNAGRSKFSFLTFIAHWFALSINGKAPHR